MEISKVLEASSLPPMRKMKVFPSKSRCVNSKSFGESFFSNETRIKLESRSRLSSKTAELLRSSTISNKYFCSQSLRLGLLMECAEMTDLHFIVATNNLSTPLGEREKPFRQHYEKEQSFCSGGQRPHERHGMSLRDLVIVPIPVHIDTKTCGHIESTSGVAMQSTYPRSRKPYRLSASSPS